MKKIIYKYGFPFCLAVALMAGTACTDDNDWKVDKSYERLFGIAGDKINVEAEDVTATVSFTGVPDAQYYIIEVSTDSLYDDILLGGTPHSIVFGQDKSITKSPAKLNDLAGDTKYFLRIKAQNPQKTDGHWAYYQKSNAVAPFKTKAEQIFNPIENSDRGEDFIHVSWDSGKEVTGIVVTDADGNEVRTIQLTDDEKNAGEYTIEGLNPSTTYIVMIQNGDAVRGTLNATTTAAMPAADFKYFLPAETKILSTQLLKDIAAEAVAAGNDETNFSVTIGIPADMTIDFHGESEDGSATNVKVPEGMSVTFFGLAGGEAPTLNFVKNIDVEGSHAFIAFENVKVVDAGAAYFVNQGNACTIGEFRVKDCEMAGFKNAFFRVQNSTVKVIEKLIIDNSIFHDMCSGYSFIHVDAGSGAGVVKNIDIDNSTLYNVATGGKMFIYSKATDMESISVRNTTFYNCIGNNNYWVDFNGAGTSGAFEFIKCLFTKTPDDVTKNIRSNNDPTFDECYHTTDFYKTLKGSNELGISSEDLFVDPENADFHFKGGRILYCGDPRWYTEE
jgi:hypothetical protein